MGLPLGAESWIWYAIAVFTVACRMVSRLLHLKSIKKLQYDDWLMLVTVASHTAFVVTINIESHYNSNLIAPGDSIGAFTPKERSDRIYGSKLTLVVEQLQCCTIWLTKTCLLFLYFRITEGLRANVLVLGLAVYIGVSFVTMEILYFALWCRPFHNYWALPTPNPQCSAATNHLITYAVFNISSDLLMLGIGFSLFLRNHLPWHRKLILCGVFGLGLFVILCSVMNKYYSFTHPFSTQWTFWYVRESSTSVIVSNIPFLWTLLRKIFKLDSFDGNSDAGGKTVPYHSQRSARGRQAPKILGHKTNGHTHSHSHSLNSSDFNSPTRTRHHSLAIDAPQAKKWKMQGVYGKEDADALAFDPWDYGNDEGLAADEATVQSDDTSIAFSDTPRSIKGRRLRDEEAQLEIQEIHCPTYHDFLEMINANNEKNKAPIEHLPLEQPPLEQPPLGEQRLGKQPWEQQPLGQTPLNEI